MFETCDLNGKKVFIFEDHATAIVPWAEIRWKVGAPVNLITLDYHSDTIECFHRALHVKHAGTWRKIEEERRRLVESIDIRDKARLIELLSDLSHDEQIDFSIRTEILRSAVVIHFSGATDSDFVGNEYPSNRIYVLANLCSVKCSKRPHDDECVLKHSNEAIESVNLEEKISRARRFDAAFFDAPYILDVDLDYFRTANAINPQDITTFRQLIRRSVAITIARESNCVIDGRLKGETIDSDYLQERLLEIIETTTA